MLLNRQEIDVNAKNYFGTTVLEDAAFMGHTETLDVLLGSLEGDTKKEIASVLLIKECKLIYKIHKKIINHNNHCKIRQKRIRGFFQHKKNLIKNRNFKRNNMRKIIFR